MRTGDLFLRTGVIAGTAGMALGIVMGISNDFAMRSVHAQINLLGWASMFLFGLFYRLVPQAEGKLARWHYGLTVAGLLTLTAGVAAIVSGQEMLAPLAKVGATLSIVGMALFVRAVFKATAARPKVMLVDSSEGTRAYAREIIRDAAR